MKKVALSLFAATFLSLSACDVQPSKFTDEEAREAAEKIVYIKDDGTGLCFALIASRKELHVNQSGIAMAHVTCSPEVEARLVN